MYTTERLAGVVVCRYECEGVLLDSCKIQAYGRNENAPWFLLLLLLFLFFFFLTFLNLSNIKKNAIHYSVNVSDSGLSCEFIVVK